MAFRKPKTTFPLISPLAAKVRKTLTRWKDFKATAGKFYPYIKKNRKRLISAQLCAIGYISMGILEPWPIKLIFDYVLLGIPLPNILSPLSSLANGNRIYLLAIFITLIVMIALVRGIFYYFQQLQTSRAGQQISSRLRVDLYSHLQSLSFSFHDRRRTGDLLSRLTTDIRIFRQILISLPITIISELFMMIGMIIIIFFMDWQLSLLALMVIPVIAVLLKNYQQPMKSAIRKQREREGHLASLAAEVFGAIKVVQGFHQENFEVEKFSSKDKSSLRSGLKAARLEAKLKWASELAVAVVTAIVLGVAAKRVMAGALSPGDILVFLAYLRKFNQPLRRVSRISEQAARGTASGERILKLFNIRPSITDLPGAVSPPHIRGEIRFQNIVFNYQNGPTILHDISLDMAPGRRIAVIGPTGCGKSTLISLLPRFYDAAEGAVLVDGIDVKQYTLLSLRRHIGLVFQEPILFAATIAENIAYGKPGATREEIVEAAQKAKIHSIIESLENGYETEIGERGGTLSGGQRQCIAIARAIIKNAPIVILDEPTTGLDDKSATLVMDALRELMKDKTVLLITHQLKTIKDVDEVIVMREGRIVRRDTPENVLSDKFLYDEIQNLHTRKKQSVA
jgi:ATP-binding cassette, subfamily B, bacterial